MTGVTSGGTQAVVLADKVELVHWQELSMMVKVHSHSISSGSGTISVVAQPRSWSEDDPSVAFICRAGPGLPVILNRDTLTSDVQTGFMRTMGPNCVGSMVRIVALGNRTSTGALNATISVDLSAKDGTSFLPTRLSSCRLWLHADDYNPLTGDWPDRSGAENHASQATQSARPIRETKFNGFNDVLSNGAAHYITANSVAAIFDGTDTAFSV